MKGFWKHLFPSDVRDIPDGGGSEAREKAEHQLAQVRRETAYYAGLGDDLRRLRERNHIADNIRASIRGV